MMSRWSELTKRGSPLLVLGLALTLFPTELSAQQLKPEKPSIKVGLPVNAISFMPIYIVRKETGREEGLAVELVDSRFIDSYDQWKP